MVFIGVALRTPTSTFNSNNSYQSIKKEKFDSKKNIPIPSFSSLGEILGKSIQSATASVLLIGGFVVIFSVVLSICQQSGLLDLMSKIITPITSHLGVSSLLLKPLLSGVIELTNGVNLVASTPIKAISMNMIGCAFLLGFGGLCVLLQVFSIASKANLSMKTYFIGKLLQGILAALYTALAFVLFPSIGLDLAVIAFI